MRIVELGYPAFLTKRNGVDEHLNVRKSGEQCVKVHRQLGIVRGDGEF